MSRCGLVLSGWWALIAPGLHADTIVLRGGGEIQGKLIVDPKTPQAVQVLLFRGRKPLTFQKAQILEVIPKPSALDGYVARKAKLDSTAQAQFELAEWCRANRLTDLAMVHYEAAVERNGSFEEAHKKLGHVIHDGQWLSPDELRKVQGLVRDRGEWITEQEKSKRDESAQMAASQSSWLRRIKLLRQAVITGAADRRKEAESDLMRIEDVEAVTPLLRAFGQDPAPLRLLMVQTLGQIKGKESTRALVNVVLADPEGNEFCVLTPRG